MSKCVNCGTALEHEDDSCLCNTSICPKCCDCNPECGCNCAEQRKQSV